MSDGRWDGDALAIITVPHSSGLTAATVVAGTPIS